jgi:hypothetical protein
MMKTHGKVVVQLHAFLTLTLDENPWSTSYPGHFALAIH